MITTSRTSRHDLVNLFRVDRDRIDVVPNGAEDALATRPEAAELDDEGGAIEATIAAFEADPGEAAFAAHRDLIERAFGADSVEEIIARLVADGSEWAREQAALAERLFVLERAHEASDAQWMIYTNVDIAPLPFFYDVICELLDEGADALIIHTEWHPYRSPDFPRMKTAMRTPLILDGRNLYDPDMLHSLGITYYAIGRGQSAESS